MSNLSFVRHVGDGTTTQFALAVAGENIGYFRTSDIKTYVDGIEVANTINVASPHLVLITPAPSVGSDVLIRREVPLDKPYADFERGNNFGQRQVNNTFLQQLYLTQEMLDGFTPEGFYHKQALIMGNHKIKDVAPATEEGDVVEFKQWDYNVQETEDRINSLEGSTLSDASRLIPFRYTATGGELSVDTGYQFSYCDLAINGVVQTPLDSFNFISGVIHLAEPLEEGDTFFAKLGDYSVASIGASFLSFVFDAVGGEVSFTPPDYEVASLYINGVYQTPNRAYARVGLLIQLAEPLESGDIVDMWYTEKTS